MSQRLKTIEFAHPVLAALVNNTLTTLTQITVYIPESGKTFRSVVAMVSAMQTITTASASGNLTTRQLQCRLGAVAYTSHTNGNLLTGSGEDMFLFHAVDLTAHFTTNWTGTSMTFDSEALFDSTGTGAAFTNVCVTLFITYEYDDTSATQIKTIRIPLDAKQTSSMDSSKPGTANATIPDLDLDVPEASKVYRSEFVTIQGNINRQSSNDRTLSMELDTTGAHTSGIFEGISTSDFWYRYIWDVSGVLDETNSMGFYIWTSGIDSFANAQVWLTITYEFDATSSNNVFVSLLLPMDLASPMGWNTSGDYQRGTREVWIEEPGTVTTKHLAFYSFWDQNGPIVGTNVRVGTGSFVNLTAVRANMVCGSVGAMTRNDAAFTLARGHNALTWDVYNESITGIFGLNLCGFWLVNYTAGKPSGGYGAANHTVFWNLGKTFDGAAGIPIVSVAAIAPIIPESDYFLTAMGTRHLYISNTTSNIAGVSIQVERLAAEGGIKWEAVYADIGQTDPEVGLRHTFSQMRDLFLRWTGDPDADRIDLETARRWRIAYANDGRTFNYLDLVFSYHTIIFAAAGDVTGSSGGGVNLALHRSVSGEKVAVTSRTGNSAYSIDWYDDTEFVYVEAVEDTTHLGRSNDDVAA